MMSSSDPPPALCPTCGRPLVKGCLHCAMQAALDAATQAADGGEDMSEAEATFASFADPVLPMTVGRFRLLARLGAGGMGTVYEAEDTKLGRTVALKMIRASRFASAGEKARFDREAAAVAQFDHENIVPLYEVGEVEGHAFLVMKVVRGGTLADRIRAGPMPPTEAARLLAAVAAAVQHAHDKGVLHRDLKPSNVLLDEAGQPWLTDFGMARMMDEESDLTTTAAQIGTPQYMSPEQAAGRAREVSPASDVWALGAMLYQMLSGKAPYLGETSLAIMHSVVSDEPPKLVATNRLERDLAVMVDRCMQKDASQRLSSAGKLASDLERWLRGEPIQSRAVRKWPAWHWGAAVALAVLGLAFVWRNKTATVTETRPVFSVAVQEGSLTVRSASTLDAALTLRQPQEGHIELVAERGLFRHEADGSEHGQSTGAIPLAGLKSIRVDMADGNDQLQLEAMSGLPSLSLSGGAGNDRVLVTGRVHFQPDASVELDFQDDATEPGNDRLSMQEQSAFITSGSGAVTAHFSRSISLEDAEISTEHGGITLSGNQQEKPTAGDFKGVFLDSGTLRSTGRGAITVQGRGGDAGIFQFGIYLYGKASVLAGKEGAVRLTGTGGNSGENDNSGFCMRAPLGHIRTEGADVWLEGTGQGRETTGSNHGLALVDGLVEVGGAGRLKLSGQGGATLGHDNCGVLLRSRDMLLTAGTGEISITGTGGGKEGALLNHGIKLYNGPSVSGQGRVSFSGQGGAGGSGIITQQATLQSGGAADGGLLLEGRGGASPVSNQRGISLGAGTQVSSAGGEVTLRGFGGGVEGAPCQFCYGVDVREQSTVTAGGTGAVWVEGAGGQGLLGVHLGVHLLTGAQITSGGGPVEVIGTGGENGAGVRLNAGGISAGGGGALSITGTGRLGTGIVEEAYGVELRKQAENVISTGGGDLHIRAIGGGSGAGARDFSLLPEALITTQAHGGKITITAERVHAEPERVLGAEVVWEKTSGGK